MTAFYFTFGLGTALAKYYVKVEANTFNIARERMVEMFSSTWAFQYEQVDYKDAIAAYHLIELELPMSLK